MYTIGILGGSGYTGKILLKYLQNHKHVKSINIYGNESSKMKIHNIFPEFVNELKNLEIKSIDNIELSEDYYFSALPHGISQKYVSLLVKDGKTVIDLSGDFRLNSKEQYELYYKSKHYSENLLSVKEYGLADVVKKYKTNLIANPGCYPTSVLVPLIPIISEFSESIFSINAICYSGTSGAGKKLNQDLLFTEMFGNINAYNVINHRHKVEILTTLNSYGYNGLFEFIPHLAPIDRGIYTTIVINSKSSFNKESIEKISSKYFEESPFVRIRKTPPKLNYVKNTNYLDFSFEVNKNSIIITSAIDNLIKGASGQAIQNFNKLIGVDEKESLGGYNA